MNQSIPLTVWAVCRHIDGNAEIEEKLSTPTDWALCDPGTVGAGCAEWDYYRVSVDEDYLFLGIHNTGAWCFYHYWSDQEGPCNPVAENMSEEMNIAAAIHGSLYDPGEPVDDDNFDYAFRQRVLSIVMDLSVFSNDSLSKLKQIKNLCDEFKPFYKEAEEDAWKYTNKQKASL